MSGRSRCQVTASILGQPGELFVSHPLLHSPVWCRTPTCTWFQCGQEAMGQVSITHNSDKGWIFILDRWTSHRSSFLGMTAHWHGEGKNSKDIIRRSACLVVRCVYWSNTYNVLARVVADKHAKFKITSKVNCMITDNGFNFFQVFKMFPSKKRRPPATTTRFL